MARCTHMDLQINFPQKEKLIMVTTFFVTALVSVGVLASQMISFKLSRKH